MLRVVLRAAFGGAGAERRSTEGERGQEEKRGVCGNAFFRERRIFARRGGKRVDIEKDEIINAKKNLIIDTRR